MDKLLESLQEHLPGIEDIVRAHEQITITLKPANLLDACNILHQHELFKFEQLIDICGVDYLHYNIDEWNTSTATTAGFSRGVDRLEVNSDNTKQSSRFAVVYHLLSLSLNQRLRLKIFVPDEPPIVPSVIDIWSCANWYEREVFDLFGIMFSSHPDLRRILTDYGFIGHPFRKDFPLIGEVEARFDATANRVVYDSVSISPRTLVPKIIRTPKDSHG